MTSRCCPTAGFVASFRLGTASLRFLRLLDDNLALEDVHLDILGGSDLDAELRTEVDNRALGSLDLKTAGLGLHDFGTDLTRPQEDPAGRNQIQLGRALNDGTYTDAKIKLDGPGTKTEFLTGDKRGTGPRRGDRMAPAAFDRTGQAGNGKSHQAVFLWHATAYVRLVVPRLSVRREDAANCCDEQQP